MSFELSGWLLVLVLLVLKQSSQGGRALLQALIYRTAFKKEKGKKF